MTTKPRRGRPLTDRLRRDIEALGKRATPAQVIALIYGERPNPFGRKLDDAKKTQMADLRSQGRGSKFISKAVGISRTQAQRVLRTMPAFVPPAAPAAPAAPAVSEWAYEQTLDDWTTGRTHITTTGEVDRHLRKHPEGRILTGCRAYILLEEGQKVVNGKLMTDVDSVRMGVMSALRAMREISKMTPLERAEREATAKAVDAAWFSFKRPDQVSRSSMSARVRSLREPPVLGPDGRWSVGIRPNRHIRAERTVLGPIPDLGSPEELIEWVRRHVLAESVMDT